MGQYYVAVLKEKNKFRWHSPYVYDNGAKLMEHSYMRNHYMVAVCKDIMNNGGKRVAWVGDYADEEDYGLNGKNEAIPKFIAYVQNVWRKDKKCEDEIIVSPLENCIDGFLVNHTKKQAINMGLYYAANVDSDGWCIHPLSLLTAIGNGKGGGDYRSDVGAELVGSWACDLIEYDTNSWGVPKGYEDVTGKIKFKE